jgi:hypothetical protein
VCGCCAQEVIRQRLRAALPNSTPLIPPDLCGAFLSSAAFFFAPTHSQQSIRQSMALIGGLRPLPSIATRLPTAASLRRADTRIAIPSQE